MLRRLDISIAKRKLEPLRRLNRNESCGSTAEATPSNLAGEGARATWAAAERATRLSSIVQRKIDAPI
jgi:hypothetical protein